MLDTDTRTGPYMTDYTNTISYIYCNENKINSKHKAHQLLYHMRANMEVTPDKYHIEYGNPNVVQKTNRSEQAENNTPDMWVNVVDLKRPQKLQ